MKPDEQTAYSTPYVHQHPNTPTLTLTLNYNHVYNTNRVKENMLRGEKGAQATRNLFGKILNGPPGRHTDKKIGRQTLEGSEHPGKSPRLAPLLCPASPCWPTGAELVGTQNPLPKPCHRQTSELIYRIVLTIQFHTRKVHCLMRPTAKPI